MKFPDELIHSYPYPLAVAAKRVNDCIEQVETFLSLANLFEVTLKYLATVSLAQYLRDQARDKQIQEQCQSLPRPTLGIWAGILRSSVGFYKKNSDRPSAMPELRDGYATKLRPQDEGSAEMLECFHFMAKHLGDEQGSNRKIAIKDLLDVMVNYRNETWGMA